MSRAVVTGGALLAAVLVAVVASLLLLGGPRPSEPRLGPAVLVGNTIEPASGSTSAPLDPESTAGAAIGTPATSQAAGTATTAGPAGEPTGAPGPGVPQGQDSPASTLAPGVETVPPAKATELPSSSTTSRSTSKPSSSPSTTPSTTPSTHEPHETDEFNESTGHRGG